MELEEILKESQHYKTIRTISFVDNPFPVWKEFIDVGSIQFIEKEWGGEIIICREPHAAKIMMLNPDSICSVHFHEEKSETFILIQGSLIVETTDFATGAQQIIELITPFSSITLPPRIPHTFYCPEGQTEPTIFIEASTKDNNYDNYRFTPSRKKNDNTGRPNS